MKGRYSNQKPTEFLIGPITWVILKFMIGLTNSLSLTQICWPTLPSVQRIKGVPFGQWNYHTEQYLHAFWYHWKMLMLIFPNYEYIAEQSSYRYWIQYPCSRMDLVSYSHLVSEWTAHFNWSRNCRFGPVHWLVYHSHFKRRWICLLSQCRRLSYDNFTYGSHSLIFFDI